MKMIIGGLDDYIGQNYSKMMVGSVMHDEELIMLGIIEDDEAEARQAKPKRKKKKNKSKSKKVIILKVAHQPTNPSGLRNVENAPNSDESYDGQADE